MTQRTDRIDELFRQEISGLLAREIADPRIGFATVTQVETTADLRHAKVWVSVIGQPDDRASTVRALERAMPFVRRELGKRLRLRRIPEFSVRLDESIERGTRVMQLINELEAGATPDGLPAGESLPTPVVRLPQAGEIVDPTDEKPSSPRSGRSGSSRPGAHGQQTPGSGGSTGGRRRPAGGAPNRPDRKLPRRGT